MSLPSRWRILLAVGIIVVAGLLAYHNSFGGPFIFDGETAIAQNPQIRQLWPIWEVFQAQPGATVAGRPVLSLSLALNYQVSGLEVWSYHAVNLAIHILAALTLFGIIRRTLLCEKLRARFGQASFSLALICALIWLLHPLQTGSVTYIVQRAESLMGLFYLLSLYCAIRGFSSTKRPRWYIFAILACALGMGTKEVVATAPFVVWLYDRIFVSRSFKEALTRRWGLYGGLAGTWVIFGVLAFTSPRGESVSFAFEDLSWLEYAMTQCQVIVGYYLKLSFWPYPLVLDYGWPIVRSFGQIVPHALVLVTLLVGTVVALRYWPSWGFLGVWFFAILAPSSSIVPILTEVAAEHRMYLPLAAVVVGVVVGGYIILVRLTRRRARLGWALGYILAGAVIVTLGSITFTRNFDYATEFSIWDVTAQQSPNNFRPYYNRGSAYRNKGQLEKAIQDFDKAIELNPSFAELYSNRGSTHSSRGKYHLAIRDYSQALQLNPTFAEACYNRGLVYWHQGEYDLALRDFEKAVQMAQSAGRKELVIFLRRQLDLYKANQPYSKPK